ncbi:hypothetical protein [Bdellovibrio sp. GT3]|uniref:hypothetical protein n=1 Tax=Bdellovibrio sp. GT3 TaxID=3136282 RepID=UPI0030F19E33
MTTRTAYLFTFVIFYSAIVQAYPNIGDKVTWSGNIKTATGNTSEVQITKEVIGFNSSSKLWKVKVHTKLGSESLSETIESADLFTPEKYKETLANCQKNGGTIETLQTTPGKYETCKLSTTNEDGTIIENWWGDIPFGIVSKETRVPATITNSEAALRVATTKGL